MSGAFSAEIACRKQALFGGVEAANRERNLIEMFFFFTDVPEDQM